MYNDKLIYNVYIWVLYGITFWKEKEALIWYVWEKQTYVLKHV